MGQLSAKLVGPYLPEQPKDINPPCLAAACGRIYMWIEDLVLQGIPIIQAAVADWFGPRWGPPPLRRSVPCLVDRHHLVTCGAALLALQRSCFRHGLIDVTNQIEGLFWKVIKFT